jgi:hypothetical protein
MRVTPIIEAPFTKYFGLIQIKLWIISYDINHLDILGKIYSIRDTRLFCRFNLTVFLGGSSFIISI